MKLKFNSRLCPLLLAIFAAVGTARADTLVTSKDGKEEKIEGKVISETETTVLFEYNLTPKIKDKKTFQKSEIISLTRLTPSQAEMADQKLEDLVPTPDLLTAGEYERIIQDKLRTFTTKHPGTPEAAKVEEIIKTLTEEKGKVLQGQLKMEGKWLDPSTVKREAYNIEAYRVRLAMQEAAKATGDTKYLNALRLFDKLRLQYPASMQYVQAIPEALEYLEAYQKQLSGMMSEQPVLQAKRDDGLKTLSGTELQITKNSIEQEAREFKVLNESQTKQKVKWRDVYKYDLKSLELAAEAVTKEGVELRAIDLEKLKTENEGLTTVIRYIADENAAGAEAAFLPLRSSRATLINKLEATRIEKELRALQDRIKLRAKSGSAAVPVASSTEAPAPATGNPIEEALKQREKERQEKAAGKTGAATDTKKPGDKPADDKTAGKSKPKTPSVPAAPAPPPPPPSMLASINEYIPYIGGGLLVILVLALVLGKKKKAE